MEQMASIKISKDAYNELKRAKRNAVKQAQVSGAKELAEAFKAMGLGAFAGWLIFRGIKEIQRGNF